MYHVTNIYIFFANFQLAEYLLSLINLKLHSLKLQYHVDLILYIVQKDKKSCNQLKNGHTYNLRAEVLWDLACMIFKLRNELCMFYEHDVKYNESAHNSINQKYFVLQN